VGATVGEYGVYVRRPISVLTRNRDFRYLFAAELVMFGGDWFVMIPLLTLLPRLTGTGLWGGLVLAADTGVIALLLPLAGTVADRIDRRKIMVTTNLASIVAVLALLLVRSSATAWVALAAIAALAVAKAFYSPAASAALPNVVDAEDLPAANALAGSAWGTMLVVGASLGGVLSSLAGPYVCFGVAASCLVLAALLLWRVRRPLQAARDRSGGVQARPFAALVEALRYIRRHPRVLSLVTVKSAVGLGNGVLTVFPVLATAVFGIGSLGTGLFFAARGAGALVGPLLMRPLLTRRSWLLPGLAVSMGVYGIAYLGVSVAPWFALALPLVVIAHLGAGGNWMMSNFALQAEVPDELRGRVFATDMMIATLSVSASQLLVGVFIDHVNPRLLVAVCGAVTGGYAVAWRLVTRRVMRRETEQVTRGETERGMRGETERGMRGETEPAPGRVAETGARTLSS
jgi:MFS family permease